MAEIEAIWIKRAHGGVMDAVQEAELVAGHGIRGNADQGGRRQITIISADAWSDAQREVGEEVPPTARRANVMLRGIDLEDTRGMQLRLGDCIIRIFGETRPCQLMDETRQGLRAALRPAWRGGVFGEIVDGGTIRVGDRAEFTE